MKKMLAIALALIMIMALAVPGMAADTHTITINQDDDGHTYGAYQIFSGVIETLNGDSVLTEVQWGTGIDSAAFLTALQTQYPALYANAATAADVAKILSDNNTSQNARDFADLAGDYLADAAGTTGALITETDDEGNVTASYYEITGLNPGYYLVQDEAEVEGETLTDYLLRLVNDVDINPKDGEVTVEKWILEGENMKKVADFVIGKPITFELHGSLPANYSRYEEFYYEFHDTMSVGLDYANDIVVEFINGDLITTVAAEDYEVAVNEVLDDNGDPTGETTLEIIFEDLVALGKKTNAEGNSLYTIHADTEIFVSYTATLNDDAIVGNPGNPNKVYIEYDNDPNDEGDGTDTTVEDVVHAFTFALDLTKTDGSTKQTLEGVGFKLYTDVANVKEYAIVNLDPEDDITDYTITGWTITASEGTLLTTTADGTFTVYGLDVGTYYLEETQPLSGYDPIADLMFTISAGYSETAQTLTSLTISYSNIVDQTGNMTDGSVDVAVVNNPGSELPSTGGIGTTLFYIFGGILACGAVVLLVTKKRMAA